MGFDLSAYISPCCRAHTLYAWMRWAWPQATGLAGWMRLALVATLAKCVQASTIAVKVELYELWFTYSDDVMLRLLTRNRYPIR